MDFRARQQAGGGSRGVSAGGRSTLGQDGMSERVQAPAAQAAPGAGAGDAAARVLFSCCKGETHTHRSGFKQLFRRLRSAYRPDKLDCADDLHPEVLLGSGGASPAVLVLGCPTQRFSAQECDALARLVRGGGGLLVLLGEGGEAAAGTNINFVLEQFGVAANADAVLRTSHHKYMHPKEALVVDGLLNRALLSGAGAGGKATAAAGSLGGGRQQLDASTLAFVYPHGCTLTVQAAAVPLLSSGRICYPMQRPLAAAWEAPPGSGGGRLLVLGSARMFDDRWLDKEENARLMDWVFKWLRPGSRLTLHPGDAEEPELSDARLLPDTEALADRPKPCLQEVRQLPRDWTRLFDSTLAGLGLGLVPEAAALYGRLGVRKAPLSLIAPGFEAPLPRLEAATFPPAAREPPPPALELFDLDDEFAAPQGRLAAVFNKCAGTSGGSGAAGSSGAAEADLDSFLIEAGAACGLDKQPEDGAKGVLSELLRQLLRYKTVGAAGSAAGGSGGAAMAGGAGSPLWQLTNSGLGSMRSSRAGLQSAGDGTAAFHS